MRPTVRHVADEKPRRHGCIDDAHHRHAIANERDVDREVADPLNEFLGAVERIDEEKLAADRGQAAGGHLLLGHDRHVRGGMAQTLEDDRLGGMIGLRHRRMVGLTLYFKAGDVDLVRGAASLDGGGDHGFEQD